MPNLAFASKAAKEVFSEISDSAVLQDVRSGALYHVF